MRGSGGGLGVFPAGSGPIGGSSATSRVFRNDLTVAGEKRALRFADVTARAGVGLKAYGMGAAAACDEDGDVDPLATAFGADRLCRNGGNGTFTDVTDGGGVSDPVEDSAAFFDYDRDGGLDLYVAHYLDFTIAGSKSVLRHGRCARLLESSRVPPGAGSPLLQRIGIAQVRSS